MDPSLAKSPRRDSAGSVAHKTRVPTSSTGRAPSPVHTFDPRAPGPTPASVLAAQRSVGNRAVLALLAVQRTRGGRRRNIRAEAGDATPRPGLNVVKVTVAGSGDLVWKTHRNKIGDKQWEPTDSTGEVRRFERLKTTSDGLADHELSFSGPLQFGGAKDGGRNTIKKLIAQVPPRVAAVIAAIRAKNRFPIHVLLRAHSRGAVAGAHIANAIASSGLRDANNNPVKLEVVLFDPVPGPGHAKKFKEIVLGSGIQESTLVYSVKSGYKFFFDPARVLGAERIIITAKPHSAGIESGFSYNGTVYTGSNLNSLERGVYVERVTPEGELEKVDDIDTAQERMKAASDAIIKRSGGTKLRRRRIREVLEGYFSGHPVPATVTYNPLYEGLESTHDNPLFEGP